MLNPRGRRRLLAAALALALIALTVPASVVAGGPKIDVIATGLESPRGLTVLKGDTVLVAEAGRGGNGPCIAGSAGSQVCLGQTGAVTAVSREPDGKFHQRRIVTGLPSLVTETGEATGPHDVAVGRHGELLIPIGLGADPAARAGLGDGGALLGQLVGAEPGGKTRPIADLAAFEGAEDPDQGLPGTAPDSNPYGVLATRRGAVVTDAGGNDVLRVGSKGGISPLAVFPPRIVPGPEPGSEIPMQPVPTTVARGPDGALYVGELTGFPFPPGGARVWRVAGKKAPEVYAEGFTNIIDIAFDGEGRLNVLEIAKNGLLSGDPAGALIRVERDGTHTEIASEGLLAPTSFAFGRGAIYVSNKGVMPGEGEVLRIQPAE